MHGHQTLDGMAADIHTNVKAYAEPRGMTYEYVMTELIRVLNPAEHAGDGRAVAWRARIRVYDCARSTEEPVAESDPELPAVAPGGARFHGLPAVAAWVAETITAFHGSPIIGNSPSGLAHKIKSLRSQMSQRGNGTGDFRVAYTVEGSGLAPARRMVARCDVVRES